jgi:pimeloyl-[acyl-carrier protein] methyl ester esterase
VEAATVEAVFGEAVAEAERIVWRQSAHEVARGVTVFHRRPSRERFLSEFATPIIVVTGAEDIAPATSAAQADTVRDGRLHVVAECGHCLPIEKPDNLNAILHDVIAEPERRQAQVSSSARDSAWPGPSPTR